MPRAYGKHELQRIIAEAFRVGHECGRARAHFESSDVPHVDDVLRNVGIEHPENVPWKAGTARSWHPGKGGGAA